MRQNELPTGRSSAELPCVTRPLLWLAIHLVLVHILIAVERVEVAVAPAAFSLAGSSNLAAVHLWVHVKETSLQKGDEERTNILLYKNTDYKAWAKKCLPQTFNCSVNYWLWSSASLCTWFPRLQRNMTPSFSRDQGPFLGGPWTPWRAQHQPLTQWCGLISRNTRSTDCTFVKTSKLANYL